MQTPGACAGFLGFLLSPQPWVLPFASAFHTACTQIQRLGQPLLFSPDLKNVNEFQKNWHSTRYPPDTRTVRNIHPSRRRGARIPRKVGQRSRRCVVSSRPSLGVANFDVLEGGIENRMGSQTIPHDHRSDDKGATETLGLLEAIPEKISAVYTPYKARLGHSTGNIPSD